MTIVIISISILFFITVLILGGYFIWTHPKNQKKEENQSLLLIQNQINELARGLDNRLHQSNQVVHNHLNESVKMIEKITRELTKVDEGQKQVIDVAKQLENLSDILKNPKQRGILGEYFLETVLKNVLPPRTYQMQYAFKDGTIVDAVIFIKDHLIPIDSKFSLENYNRILESKSQLEKEKFEALFYDDLKTRINETAKYIKPEEGTYEFAFMFIPSEAVYYDLLINKVGAVKSNTRDLINYATGEKKVMIVSPTTFLAYLQTVLQGLKAMQIEESAKEIKKNVETLGKHLASYGEYLLKIGTNLGTTVNIYNQASKEFHKIDKDIYRITGVSENIEIPLIEKPET